jgi:glycosyltransferase involved in cell wall biosynthesis
MIKNELSLVSVLMPNYNNEKYLGEAIESILNQTYKNIEFIIVDDCSTDNSWDVILKCAKLDSRIRVYKNEKNLGIVKTRNKLFSLVDKNSKYFAIFDSDDISLPKRLEKQVDFLEKNSDFGIVGSNITIINENSKIVGIRNYQFNVQKIKFIKSPFAQPSVMFRRNVLDSVRYSSDFDVCEDFDLWFRILAKSKGENLNFTGLKYRISSTQSKSTHLKKTIKNTLVIKFKYMELKNYLNFMVVFRIVVEFILLLLPNKLVSWLFSYVEIKK